MLRDHFPRLFELRDLLPDPLPPQAALPALDDTLMSKGKREFFEGIEAELQRLDDRAWAALKVRFTSWPKKGRPGRELEPLHDALNEARAYNYLRDAGCSNVHFIPVSTVEGQKTPDLGAEDQGRQVLCDAKTINRSDYEIDRFASGGVGTSTLDLSPQLLDKVRKTAACAKGQMLSYDPSGKARKIVYMFLNFDDHEYSSSYLRQLERFRASNPVPNVEIVFKTHPC
jgi:hypothetical protein